MALGLLSGRAPMPGLLQLAQQQLPLASMTPPIMADAADEAMLARNPNGLLSGPPQRRRVSGWRVLDRVLGGQTISEGLDAERERLAMEANAPAMAEQQQRLRDLVAQLSPTEQIAFAANPQELGKALASNSEAFTLGAGGLRGGRDGVVATAPTFSTVNDTIFANDPSTRQSTVAAIADPGFDDLTQRQKAESDAELARQNLALNQQKAAVDAQVGLGGLAVDQGGLALRQQELAQKQADTDKTKAAQSNEALQVAASMETALGRAREYVNSGGYWNGRAPILSQLNAQGRANLEGQLDTLKGNLTFEKLMEMKANSPTGASGLGALSDNEARLLSSTAASLSVDMSPQELERSFSVIDRLVAKVRQQNPQGGQPQRPQSRAEYDALPSGATFIAPDGTTRRKP